MVEEFILITHKEMTQSQRILRKVNNTEEQLPSKVVSSGELYPDLSALLKSDMQESISKLKAQYRKGYVKPEPRKNPNSKQDEKKKEKKEKEERELTPKERAEHERKVKVQLRKEKAKEKRNVFKEMMLSVEESLEVINKRETNLVCIDIECFERQTYKITEIGVSIYNPKYQRTSLFPHILNMHFIPSEHNHLDNYVFVPDNKYKNVTGQSTMISLNKIPDIFLNIFEKLGSNTAIVGHEVIGDLSLLQDRNVKFPDCLRIIDTKDLWLSLVGAENDNVKSGLGYILDKLCIPHAFMHNGVNDSYYTLLACLLMGSTSFRNNSRSSNDLFEFGIDDTFTRTIDVKVAKNKNKKKDKVGDNDGDSDNGDKEKEMVVEQRVVHRMPTLKFNISEDHISEKNKKVQGSRSKPIQSNKFFATGRFSKNALDKTLNDLVDFPKGSENRIEKVNSKMKSEKKSESEQKK